MKRLYKIGKIALFASATLTAGCMGGGFGNNGGYPGANYPNAGYPYGGNPYGNNPYGGNPYGGYSNGGAQSGLGGALIAAIIQGMASSVFNGQIGSQLAPVDQNFRLQQLGGLLQNGSIGQSQQWLNPQTGSKVAINPIGQLSLNPQTQQKCQNLQETITLPDGRKLQEKRTACLDPATGKWNLVK